MDDDIKNYKALAADIVKMACVDYVDARIIQIAKTAEIKRWRDKIMRLLLEYGRERYITRQRGKLVRQGQTRNIRMLLMLRKLLDDPKIHEVKEILHEAEEEIRADLEFFRSGTFDIYMPGTNTEALINRLDARAERGERVDKSVKPYAKGIGQGNGRIKKDDTIHGGA